MSLYEDCFRDAKLALNEALDSVGNEVVEEWVRQGRRMTSAEDVLNPQGCSTEDIESVRATWQGWMPDSFHAFLLVLGRMSRQIDVGINCYYPAVLDAAAAYADWRDETETLNPSWYSQAAYELPQGALPVGHHEGYSFGFFVERGDDPHLLRLIEGDESPVSTDDLTFSERVCEAIERRAQLEVARLRRLDSRMQK